METCRTGEKFAHIALTAELCNFLSFQIIDLIVENSHHLMRLHVVSQKIARTHVCAHPALFASRFVDSSRLFHRDRFPTDQEMAFLQDHEAFVLLRDESADISHHRSHHRTAVDNCIVGEIFDPRKFQHIYDRCSDRDLYRHPVRYIACYSDVLLRYRNPPGSLVDIKCCLRVDYNTSYHDRDPCFRNDSSGQLVYQHLLVACRIYVRKFSYLHVSIQLKSFDPFFKKFDDFSMFTLDTDDRFFRAYQSSGFCKTPDDLIRVNCHQLLVNTQQRFTFRSVHQYVFCL